MNGYEKMEMEQAFGDMAHLAKPIAEVQVEYYNECISNGFSHKDAMESSMNYVYTILNMGGEK